MLSVFVVVDSDAGQHHFYTALAPDKNLDAAPAAPTVYCNTLKLTKN
jgi:hypothetical protein